MRNGAIQSLVLQDYQSEKKIRPEATVLLRPDQNMLFVEYVGACQLVVEALLFLIPADHHESYIKNDGRDDIF